MNRQVQKKQLKKVKKRTPNKSLKLFGKQIKTDKTFKKQTGVDRFELSTYKKEKEPNRYVYDKDTKGILKMNIRTDDIKPINAVFKDWKIVKKPKKDIINADVVLKNKAVILKDTKYLYDNNAHFKGKITINLNDARKFKLVFNGNINDLVKDVKRELRTYLNGLQAQEGIFYNQDEFNNLVNNMTIEPLEFDENRQVYNMLVRLTYTIQLSDTEESRSKTYSFNGLYKDLNDFLVDKSIDYLSAFELTKENRDRTIENAINEKEILTDHTTGQSMTIDPQTMRMRDANAYNICNIFNNVIEMTQSDENCVKQYLKYQYKKISDKTIERIGTDEGVNCYDITNFTSKYNIKTLIYDIEGNIISSFYPEKPNKSYKSLVGISYNNHFYALKNEILNKVSIPTKTVIKKNIDNEFKKIIDDKIIPSNISIMLNDRQKQFKISSYSIKNDIFISNDNYDVCNMILDKFGLKDKITPYTTYKNICSILESVYIPENIYSFFKTNGKIGSYNYFNKNVDIERYYSNFKTIDHNKFYSNCLKDLDYLISTDMRQKEPKNIYYNSLNDIFDLVDHYLYIAKPYKPNVLMPNKGVYTGEHLYFCHSKNIHFEIFEEIETKRHQNYYSALIKDIYDKLTDEKYTKCMNQGKYEDLRKYIINIMIGKFEQDDYIASNYKVSKVCNFEERKKQDGYFIKYNDNLYFKVEKVNEVKKIMNKLPINIQVKEMSRRKLFDKINKLGIKDDDLVCINVDAITYINRGQKQTLSSKDWTKWKQIYKPFEYYENIKKTYDNEVDENINATFKLPQNKNNNILYNSYAGAGKTHTIINEIIPKEDNYIILTPSHNSAKEYYKLGVNCKVIQTYTYNNTIPDENVLIIDEIGLCDREAHILIYKCMLLNKKIYGLGDFRQLLPVNETAHFNTNNYLNHIFSEIKDIKTNYRNNFTTDYYDSLINSTDKIYLNGEVQKYNNDDYKTAEIIICFKNTTKDKYNKLMTEHLNIKFGDVGCKIICNSNDMKDKGIYNNFDFTIKDIIDDKIILDDDTEITKKELDKHFVLGYAITLYKAQGQQFKSFYYAVEDIRFLDGRSTYTLISRLKQDVKIPKKPKEKKHKIDKRFIIEF